MRWRNTWAAGPRSKLHLPELTRAQAIMLMDNLPRLRREPIATKLAVYRKVGGHPKSIELLEGWLASGKVTDLLADPSLDGMLAQQWADYFLRALLAQLTAAERDALARLCIFETSLDQEKFDYAEIKPEWVRRWLDLSLVQRAGGGCPIFRPPCCPCGRCCRKAKNANWPRRRRTRCIPWCASRGWTDDEGRKTKGARMGRGVLRPAVRGDARGRRWPSPARPGQRRRSSH